MTKILFEETRTYEAIRRIKGRNLFGKEAKRANLLVTCVRNILSSEKNVRATEEV